MCFLRVDCSSEIVAQLCEKIGPDAGRPTLNLGGSRGGTKTQQHKSGRLFHKHRTQSLDVVWVFTQRGCLLPFLPAPFELLPLFSWLFVVAVCSTSAKDFFCVLSCGTSWVTVTLRKTSLTELALVWYFMGDCDTSQDFVDRAMDVKLHSVPRLLAGLRTH
jgi:hypothetical protein